MNTSAGVRAVLDHIPIPLGPLRRLPVRVLDPRPRDDPPWSESTAATVLENLAGARSRARAYRPTHGPLSADDWQIVDLLCAGLTTGRIAAELIVPVAAAHSHIERVMAQLGVETRAELVAATAGLYSNA